MTLPKPVENVVKEFAKYAAVVLVVLGAVPAIAQAAGAAHIVVPSALLGYAAIAAGVLGGVLRLLKDHGITPASVASSVAHRTR